ncbi:MAG: DUF402 domain-containing protein [Pseudomonadales bacterium]|nr:DUF402 domain-containing protein [Pseudomonadales bacterium]
MNLAPIQVRSYKADGAVHRYCDAGLELVNETGCVVWTHPGTEMKMGDGRSWTSDTVVRSLFVFGARLDLLEIHETNGSPRGIYMNVTSPIRFDGSTVWYTDHELDIYKAGDARASIEDEDEFEEAIRKFSYADALVADCLLAAQVGVSIAECWQFNLPSEEALTSLDRKLSATHE